MSVLLQAEIAKLSSQGVAAGDLLPGEMEALVHACDRMASPFSAVNVEAAGFPVRVSEGVTLWRLSVGAIVWLDEFAARWWGEGSEAFKWATVYAMRHGRDRGAFSGLVEEEAAYRAVRDDAVTVDCTEDEIAAAMGRFHVGGADAPPPPRGGWRAQTDWRALVQDLAARTGIDEQAWAWGRSAEECAAVFHRHCEFAAASGGARVPRMRDELDRATTHLARVEAGIVGRVKAARGEGQ